MAPSLVEHVTVVLELKGGYKSLSGWEWKLKTNGEMNISQIHDALSVWTLSVCLQ